MKHNSACITGHFLLSLVATCGASCYLLAAMETLVRKYLSMGTHLLAYQSTQIWTIYCTCLTLDYIWFGGGILMGYLGGNQRMDRSMQQAGRVCILS